MKDNRILHVDSEIGKIIVNKCLSRGYEINTQKLQKLMVLMHARLLTEHNKPFLRSKIIASKTAGVMIPQVDSDFIMYGLEFPEKFEEYVLLTESQETAVNNILARYGAFDVFEIFENTKLKSLNDYCLKQGLKYIPNDLIKKAYSSVIVDWDNLDFDLSI